MDNLQTEVLELEFNEFSKGQTHISELDFAKILLRYTYLATDEYDVFLERLLLRVKDEKGISFCDFRDFCHFLNNLDDFTIAMRMYTLADRAISKGVLLCQSEKIIILVKNSCLQMSLHVPQRYALDTVLVST